MILNDTAIHYLAVNKAMINPYYPRSVTLNERGDKVSSFGLTSYGYDISLGRNFMFYRGEENKVINFEKDGKMSTVLIESKKGAIIDPNNFDIQLAVQVDDVDVIYIPPKTFFLGVSKEYIKVPRDIKVSCDSKSTSARSGIVFGVTPLEPEWEGFITLEFYNSNDSTLKLISGMGISQLEFKSNPNGCHTSYKDRKGKYNYQGNQPIPPLQKS